jgi:TRAP-type C4-dicarboxylate transport system substrate-binding protein
MKGCYEMKFWEVQDYFVNAFGENYIGIVVANRGFFETLPVETQQMLVDTWTELIAPIAEWNLEVERESIESIKQQRPVVQFYELTGEEMDPFKEKARTVYPIYEEIGGEGAAEILATLLADVEAAKAKLGVKY